MLREFLVLWFMACSPVYAADYLLFAPGQDEPAEHRVADKAPAPGVDMPDGWVAKPWIPEAGYPDYRLYRDLGSIKGVKRYIAPKDNTPPPAVPDLPGFLDDVVKSGLFSSDEILQILVVSKLDQKDHRDKFILLFLSKAEPEKQAALAGFAASRNIELPRGE